MVKRLASSFLLLLCLATGWGQGFPDLASDPRLQQRVDVRLKRVSLQVALKDLEKSTTQKLLFDNDLEPLMVCAFAHKKPLWLIMQGIADVFGCRWKDAGGAWRLVIPKETNAMLDDYRKAENDFLCREVRLRGEALAKLASKQPWVQGNNLSQTPDREPAREETPEQWAERVIVDPAYYGAGIMISRTSILNGGGKFDCDKDLMHNFTPVAYRLVAPPSAAIANTNQCGPVESRFEKLNGLRIAVRSLNWAGSLQAALISGIERQPDKPALLIRHPRPTAELAKTPSGKWLLEWETSLAESNESELDAKIPDISPPTTHFNGGAKGIEEYLEAFSDCLDVPVVSDGFREPIIGNSVPVNGSTVRDWLIGLRKSQGCFVRLRKGLVTVRHGGFWNLRDWEPPEDLFEHMEGIRKPGLDDYAAFAYSVLDGPHGPHPFCAPFFESQQVPLTTFNLRPIMDSLLALAAFGQLDDRFRSEVLAGEGVDWYRSESESKAWSYSWAFQTTNKKTTWKYQWQYGYEYSGSDRFVNAAACFGPFFAATSRGFESSLLESFVSPAAYRHLWGDSPDDDTKFVYQYDRVGIYHAHYVSLLPGTARPAEQTATGLRLTGSYNLFFSIDDRDGEEWVVEIPE